MMLIPELPDWSPITKIIEAPESYVPEYRGPEKFLPEIQSLPDGGLAIDWWVDRPARCAGPAKILIRVWRRADHPNIAKLPRHCPRIVRSLYTADYQLRTLRAGSCDPKVSEVDRAWINFHVGLSC